MISIELGLICLISLIMVVSILVGLIQGFKRNMFHLVATILFWVIFWITAPLIKGKIIWYNEGIYQSISGILPSLNNPGDVKCLMDYLRYTVAEMANLDVSVVSDPAFENTIIAIAQSVIKIVYLIIYSIIFSIVRRIIYVSIFRKYCKVTKRTLRKLEKKQERYIVKHEQPNKKLEKRIAYTEKALKKNKIYRPLGLASGFLRGLLSSFLILCIINSTIKLLPGKNEDDITASTEDEEAPKLSLYDFILDYCGDGIAKDAVEMIHEYQRSTLMNVTGIKIGKKSADDLFIDSILSGKSEDYSFAIRKELSLLIQVAENLYSLTNGFDFESIDLSNITQSQAKNAENILTLLSDDDLINNLGTALVGVTLSLDAVAEYMPSEIKSEEYKSIIWHDELTTIASLVSKVYSCIGSDFTNIDYFNLDTEKVEDIFLTLSNLKSINLLGHIGANLGIKTLAGDDPEYAEQIASLEEKLANLAVNGDIANTISDYKTLYTQFISILTDCDFDKYKDEEGNVNYITALTSVNTTKYQNVVETVLETNFISEILPDVLTIVKGKLIPQEYASLINPNVVTSSQLANEIGAVLTIIHDITTEKETNVIHPFETIEKYDFALLRNFTPETVVESELLSYAIIKLFVDTSKSEGILSDVAGDIANYVCVPDYLTQLNEETHTFANKWYGSKTGSNKYQDGELYIMLNTIKNCASQLESLKNPVKSIPAILAEIDKNQIVNCDVLYYTLNKLIQDNRDMIVVPVSETVNSSETVNGVAVANMVKREALMDVIGIFTNPNIIDLEQLYSYHKYNPEDGSFAEQPTKYEDIENFDDYIVKLSLSEDKVFGLLTSKKLYDPAKNDETNLNELFKSAILRATITELLTTYVGDVIVVPDSATDSAQQCLKLETIEGSEEKVLVTKDIRPVKIDQFKALIYAIDELDVNISSLMDDPMSIVDSLTKDNDLKPAVEHIFTPTDSKYSGILHATLSKYVIDFSSDSSDGLSIVIPNEALDAYDNKLISSNETISLIRTLSIVGTDIFTDSSSSENDIINKLLKKIIDNNKALDSKIILATLTNYINDPEGDIQIPEEALDSTITSKDVVLKEHVVDLLNTLEAIRIERSKELSKPVSYTDLLDINNLAVSTLMSVNKQEGNPISKSLILRGILTKQIEKNVGEIPSEAKDGSCISISETNSLVDLLGDLLGESSDISNINVENLKISKLNDMLDALTNSLVAKKLVTDELCKQEDVIVPDGCYDEAITSTQVLSNDELTKLVNGLVVMLGESSVNDINIESISIGNIKEAIEKESLILNATITKQINKLEEDGNVNIPLGSYVDAESKQMIKNTEMTSLINGLCTMLGTSTTVNNINIDDVTVGNIKDAKTNISTSLILNATVTKQIKQQESDGNVVIPNGAYESDETKEMLKNSEMDSLLDGLCTMLGTSTTVNNINIDDVTVGNIKNAKTNISTSLILNATVTKQLNDNNDIIVPEETYQDSQTIKTSQMNNLIDGLVSLLGEETSINNINVDSINLENIQNAKDDISTSLILNATITNQLNINEDIIVPNEAYDDANSKERLKTQQMNYFIDGAVKLLGKNVSVNNIDISSLNVGNINEAKEDLSKSLVLNATVTKQIKQQESDGNVIIPNGAYESDVTKEMLKEVEMNALLGGLCTLLGNDTSIDNINIENVKVGNIKDAKDDISSSLILNATVTDTLKDQNGVVVPSEAYEDSLTLKTIHMNAFVDGLVSLLGENTTVNNIDVESINLGKIQTAKNDISSSYILNATFTKQLSDNEDVVVPDAAYVDANSKERLIVLQMNNFIDGAVNLLGTSTTVNNIDISSLNVGNINDAKEDLSKSLVLNATVTKQIKQQENDGNVIIPNGAYESVITKEMLKEAEMNALLGGLCTMLGNETAVNNININTVKVGNIKDAKTNISSSLILNATVTDKLKDQNGVVVPSEAYEDSLTLKTVHMNAFVDGLVSLLGEDTAVNNIDIDTINLGKIQTAKDDISSSLILNATITKQLSDNGDVIVPDAAYVDCNSKERIVSTQMGYFIDGAVNLLGTSTTVNNIDISSLTVGKINTAKSDVSKSLILNATVTKQIKQQESDGNVIIPNGAYESDVTKEMLTEEQMNTLLGGLCTMLGNETAVNNINIEAVTVGKIKDAKVDISTSLILNATVTDKLKDQNGIVIPSETYEDSLTLKTIHMNAFVDGLVSLLGEETSINNIDIDTINLGKIQSAKVDIAASYVLNATITKQLNDNSAIVVPSLAYVDDNSKERLTNTDMTNFIDGAVDLLGASTTVNNIEISTLTVGRIKDSKDSIGNSLVLRATITKQLKEQEESGNIIIPLATYDSSAKETIKQAQITVMIDGLDSLLGSSTLISAISVDNIKISDVYESRINIANSNILNATIADRLNSQPGIIEVPDKAYSDEVNREMLKYDEMINLLTGLNTMVDSSRPITDVDVNSMTVLRVNNSKLSIQGSLILKATLTLHVKGQTSIVVPECAYDESGKIINDAEIDAFINTLNSLFNPEDKLVSLPVDSLTLTQLSSHSDALVQSNILKATITDKIDAKGQDGVIVIPASAYDENNMLTNSEISYIFHGLATLYGDTPISGVANFSGVNLNDLNSDIDSIVGSIILRSTVSRELLALSDIVVLLSDIDSEISDYNTIKATSLKALFASITCMNITNFNSITKDNIKVPVEHKDTIVASAIMRASVTANTKVKVDGNDTEISVLLTDADVERLWTNNKDVLVLNEVELARLIEALSYISASGEISVEIDIVTLTTALSNGKLDAILDSSILRFAIAKYLCDGFTIAGMGTVSYLNTKVTPDFVSSHPEYPFEGSGILKNFASPTSYDVYTIPSTTPTTINSLTKIDIIMFVAYVSTLMV